jgi:hypothetical protein
MKSSVFKTKLCPVIFCFCLCATGGRAMAQVSCREENTFSIDLTPLFELAGLDASFSGSKYTKQCSYLVEGLAQPPTIGGTSNYISCSNWVAQKQLEQLDLGVLNALLATHNKTASIGSEKLQLENRFAYTSWSSSNRSLNGRQQLSIYVLGKRLPLPPHTFQVDFDLNSSQNLKEARWQSDNYSFSLSVPVPIPGTSKKVEVGLEAAYDDFSSLTKNRGDFYNALRTYTSTIANFQRDWQQYPSLGTVNSNYWNNYWLRNSWSVFIQTPWIGLDYGLASAKLRFVLDATIQGDFKYQEDYNWVNPDEKRECPAFVLRTRHLPSLQTVLSGSGKIKVKFTLAWFEKTKSYKVIGEAVESPVIQYPVQGISVSIPTLDNDIDGTCSLEPCVATAIPVVPTPATPNLESPPAADPPTAPIDMSSWAADVADEVEKRYFICDRNKREWTISSDKEIRRIEDSVKQGMLSRAEAAKRIEKYLRQFVFLCERSCQGVCLLVESEEEKTIVK